MTIFLEIEQMLAGTSDKELCSITTNKYLSLAKADSYERESRNTSFEEQKIKKKCEIPLEKTI